MIRFLALLNLLLLSASAFSQTFTDSNLPIVIISTDGSQTIQDEPKIPATMKIVYRGPGQRTYVTDQDNVAYLNYNGRIGIEIRGSSSQDSPKKSYGFETRMADDITNNNVSLLGMPKENDWILGGMVFDTALIRDFLSHNLFRRLGNYGSRAAYCEVIVNDEYRGLYILQEKIKADDNRVDVIKITTSDNILPELSGGYITKADKTTGGDPVAWIMYSWLNWEVNYIHDLPEPEAATYFQTAYIKDEFFKLKTTAENHDPSPANGYPSLIDIPSFIDFILVNELGSNCDAYSLSTYFHKDRNGKLRAGPVWDNDLTYGNDLFMWGYDRSHPDVWQLMDGGNDGSKFWYDLFHDNDFRCYLSKRYHEMTEPGRTLNQARLYEFIDSTYTLITEAAARDYLKWNKTGSLPVRINAIKSFIAARLTWINANIGSYDECSNVSLPQLVITRIMYHPQTSGQFTVEDDLEFIELRNSGITDISLTGIYFMGTGLVYQFPANSILPAGSTIILASNSSVFQAKYGFAPFGQYTRHLSNSSENIILGDAFGNVIDFVPYSDTAPWPDADGNGYHLKLANINSDNSLPASWIASNEVITAVEDPRSLIELNIYPNPAITKVNIESETEITSVTLYDMKGTVLINMDVNSTGCAIDLSGVTPGSYIIRVTSGGKAVSSRLIKR